ncbi:hypothetical protein ABS71_19320 [bacterium SCN 62-11]|nr:hypothetical protein [Candidatus Eremiobacteraeota bacterium]ODT57803.1 MAG: hypothetical protein ABS71_19320 [bacterium SCN 62-11]
MDPIAELVAEGRKESSGSFTMDLLAAQRKLAKVSQLEPGLMLGKIVQAAVVARATQVRFAVSARDIVAKINFPESARTDQEVQEHMATAFALAQGLRPRELTWTCAGLTRQFTGRVSGEGALKTEGLAVFRFEGRYPTLWEEIRSWVVARRDAACLLRERAYLCPIPVFLDAVRLNHPGGSTGKQGAEVVQVTLRGGVPRERVLAPCPRSCSAQVVGIGDQVLRGKNAFWHTPDPRFPLRTYILEGADRPRVSEPGSGTFVLTNIAHFNQNSGLPYVSKQWEWDNPDPYLSPETTLESQFPSLCARRWISLFPDTKLESELWPVQDGLLLNKLPLSRCPGGARVIMPVREMNLDLDQLNVLQDERFQEIQEELMTELPRLRAHWEGMKEPQRATTL